MYLTFQCPYYAYHESITIWTVFNLIYICIYCIDLHISMK